MLFFWFLLPFVALMVLVGSRNRNEREDEDPTYEDEESSEGEEDLEGGNEASKTSTPLW